ncbi:MAG: TetR/AcrR family transcriptional regulator [Armatimonadota bacterium]
MGTDARSYRRHSDQTRDRLLTAGLDLLINNGYHGATTREIAMGAGVTEVTMYRHFSSKEELFVAAITKLTQRLLDLVPKPSGDIEADLLLVATALQKHFFSAPSSLVHSTPELKGHPKLRNAFDNMVHQFKVKVLALIHYYQGTGEMIQENDDTIFSAFVGPVYFSSLGFDCADGLDCRRYVRLFLQGYQPEDK